MRSLTRFADKLVNRLAPKATADAATCGWYACGTKGCMWYCCAGKGCGACACP